MTATNGDLVAQIREAIDKAHQEGRHRPGRPALVKLTGATDHDVRKALTTLANEQTDAGDPTVGPLGDDGEPHTPTAPTAADTGDRPAPVLVATGEHGDTASSATHPSTSAGTAPSRRTPPGGKLVAWTGFVFGSVMSIAANVLHAWLPAPHQPPGWSPGIPPQIGAAVWPIGLMLAVEALSRVHWPTGLTWGLARYGGAGTVALGSAVISYGHLRDVLQAWHYGTLAAAVGPLVLDGLMTVCGFALLANTLTNPGATVRSNPGPDTLRTRYGVPTRGEAA